MVRMPSRLSAADKLTTVELYFELQSTHKVAEKLGISQSSIRVRLKELGIRLRKNGASPPAEHYNDMNYVNRIKAELRSEIKHEKKVPVRRFGTTGVPASVQLETLQHYLELENTTEAGKRMGISPKAVCDRLRPLGVVMHEPGRRRKGVRLADINNMNEIAQTIERLKAAAALEQQNT